jgi:polyisoprenyl-phosphate glycosyltransferase
MSQNSGVMLSVISPVYRAEAIVDELVRRIGDSVRDIPAVRDYEIILVNDGSPDASWEKIQQNCARDPHVRGVRLSRNFGQHAAIEAGIAQSSGDYLAVLDCDLQEDPAYIKDLLDKALQGADVVFTRKTARRHSATKNLSALVFKLVFSLLLPKGANIYDRSVGTFSLISRKVADAYLQVGDMHKPYAAILGWLGFKSDFVEIEHKERFAGESSYSFLKSLGHALNGIITFSEKPLYISIIFGCSFSVLSGLYGLFIIFRAFFLGIPVPGWPSLLTAVVFTSGVVMVSLGITALYIAKIFIQTKGRPRYVIDERL